MTWTAKHTAITSPKTTSVDLSRFRWWAGDSRKKRCWLWLASSSRRSRSRGMSCTRSRDREWPRSGGRSVGSQCYRGKVSKHLLKLQLRLHSLLSKMNPDLALTRPATALRVHARPRSLPLRRYAHVFPQFRLLFRSSFPFFSPKRERTIESVIWGSRPGRAGRWELNKDNIRFI